MAKRALRTKKVAKPAVFNGGTRWTVVAGELRRGKGNPGTRHLFRVVAEKLPFDAFSGVKKHFMQNNDRHNGVYIAHDSMGTPRYIGRGNVFNRLAQRQKAQPLELAYFSFYIVEDRKHEREIESLLIRAAGPLLDFNTQKKRVGIGPASLMDFEAGTKFYERQRRRGRAKGSKKKVAKSAKKPTAVRR